MITKNLGISDQIGLLLIQGVADLMVDRIFFQFQISSFKFRESHGKEKTFERAGNKGSFSS